MSQTTSPLVVILEGEDAFAPEYLEKACRLLSERDDLSFVSCARQEVGAMVRRWKPPPYTTAAALGRGVCGHLSSVFRREVWTLGDGFDERLPAEEDLDFWLRALARGCRGAILDEALVTHKASPRRRRHADTQALLAGRAALIESHLDPRSPRGEDVFATMLQHERELAWDRRRRAREHHELQSSIGEAWSEIDEAQRELAARDLPALDWGELAEVNQCGMTAARTPVEAHLAARALGEMSPDRHPRRTVTIRPGGLPLVDARAAHDLIVLDGALECEPDPAAALTECRRLLRPGGELVVVAGALPLGGRHRYGFTVAGLRRLLSQAFPASTVDVRSYGNLLTRMATAANAPIDVLSSDELELVDPRYPTIVAASARLPQRSLRRRAGSRGLRRELPDRPRVRNAAILAFGSIAALHPDSRRLGTRPELFKQQLAIVARHYRLLPLLELARQATADGPTPGSVAVTLDGGRIDALELASPILYEMGIPVTAFVELETSEEPREHWRDSLERIMLADEPMPERLRLAAGGVEWDLPTASREQRLCALVELDRELAHHGQEAIADAVNALRTWSGMELEVRDGHRLMRTAELADFARRPGHSIGAYVPASRLTQSETLVPALGHSRRLLGDAIGCPVLALAYVSECPDLAVTSTAAAAGFTVGCARHPDPVTIDSDPLRLPRVVVGQDRAEDLEVRLERLLLPA